MSQFPISDSSGLSDWLINAVGYKLPRMKHAFSICGMAEMIVLLCVVVQSVAQSVSDSNRPQASVVLTKLSPPTYPPLARQTRIAGDVELTLDVRSTGSVTSVTVVSGHPLLTLAALQSAQQSQFECRNCNEGVRSYRLWYTFQLVGPACCTAADGGANNSQPNEPIPRVIQSPNHVTMVNQPFCSCGASTPSRKKVRSAKCLYLWKCGFARSTGYEW